MANSRVLPAASVVLGKSDCSMGWNTLTSPLVGFTVPMKPTTNNTPNIWVVANTKPVAIISSEPTCNKVRRANPEADVPVSKVSSADPSSMPVTMTPIRAPL